MPVSDEAPLGFATSYGLGLLCDREPSIDAGAIVDKVTGKVKVDVFSSSDEIVGLAFPELKVNTAEGERPAVINIVRWFKALDRAEFADVLDQTWDWPDETRPRSLST